MEDKRKEIGDAASKLRNGLDKLIDTRQKVEAMTIELEETRVQLAAYQKQCDEYLIVIVQQERLKNRRKLSWLARKKSLKRKQNV